MLFRSGHGDVVHQHGCDDWIVDEHDPDRFGHHQSARWQFSATPVHGAGERDQWREYSGVVDVETSGEPVLRALLLFLLTVPVFGQVVVSDAINQNRLFGRWLTTGLQAPSSVNPTLLCSQQINRPLVGSSAVNNTGIKYRNRNALYFTGASMSYTNTDSGFPTGDFTVEIGRAHV